MSLSSLTKQTLARASFRRPLTFLRTVFSLLSSGVWSVSSLVKGVRLAAATTSHCTVRGTRVLQPIILVTHQMQWRQFRKSYGIATGQRRAGA